MTIEQFMKHWGLDKKQAQSYLAKLGFLKKVGGRYQYLPEEIQKSHEYRLNLSTKKQPGEMDFIDIYDRYKSRIGYNRLQNMTKTNKFVPVKRKCTGTYNIKRIWDEKAVDEFFKTYERYKRPYRYINKQKPKKLSNESAMRIYFLTGRTWKIGAEIKTRFNHCSILQSLRD